MTLSDGLIFGDSLHNKKDTILNKIQNRKMRRGLYCISLPTNKRNILDIYRYNELLQPALQAEEIHVVGLASSREEAIGMIMDMLEEVYHATDGFDVAAYYKWS